MSDFYGPADRGESIATLHAALDAGVFYIDTGDFYGSGHNEMLIGEAIKDRQRENIFIAVKFGGLRAPDGGFLGFDARPPAVKNFLSYTLKRLGTDYIDLYQPSRVDPTVPVEDTIGAIAEMVQAGYVRHIGVSEFGVENIRRANAVHPITWLQIEYSLISRGIEKDILPALRELGIGVTVYGVLSRGLLSGHWGRDRLVDATDRRNNLPRFSSENLDHNLALVETLRGIAEEKGVSVAQLATAWVLAQGEDIIPLVGARTRTRLQESLSALDVELTPADQERLAAAFPLNIAVGDRYDAHGMNSLDSEK